MSRELALVIGIIGFVVAVLYWIVTGISPFIELEGYR